MRDHENENHLVNCGYYNKLWGLLNIRWTLRRAPLGGAPPIRTFHKDQIAQTEGNKSLVKE